MMSSMCILFVVVAATQGAEHECEESARAGVFFSDEDFPGTPGRIANRKFAAGNLAEHVSRWRTPYDASAGPLTREEHTQFFDDGFVVLHDVLPIEVIDDAVAAVDGLVDGLARKLLAAGKITSMHAGAGVHAQLVRIEEEFPHASVLLHKNGILPAGIQRVWSHPKLIGVAQQLLGTDAGIAGHPVWNLRCKTPETLSGGQATVPWHQDNAYLAEESWHMLQVTAWVPLVDTNTTNGCMQVVRGAHTPGGTVRHACCVGGTWYVETTPAELAATLGADMAADVVTCPVPRRGVLLLNNLTPHRSLPNLSDGIRWSLDLRWQRHGEPNGFEGIKRSVLMKPAHTSYNGTVDFGDWAVQDRTKLMSAAHAKQQQRHGSRDDERTAAEGEHAASERQGAEEVFDTTIAGPWMKAWPLVHRNRHTLRHTDMLRDVREK